MTLTPEEYEQVKHLPSGAKHYRAFVGPPDKYDLVSAVQFNLLTHLGLREHHSLLDIGCGSLRGGKLFIPYLLPGRYFGIEPEQWLIDEGIKNEVGEDLINIKQPLFKNDSNFTLSMFDQKFDFILAQSVFSHASQIQIRRCLSEAKKVMKPTSIFTANFSRGEQNYEGGEWVYPGAARYTLERMIDLVKEQGLMGKPINWPHPNGLIWIVIVNPENEQNIPDITDVVYLSILKNELMSCKEKLAELKLHQERLSRLEAHPYVKFGMKINQWIRRITGRKYE